MLDTIPRYTPGEVMTTRGGVRPVLNAVFHPPGTHRGAIRSDMGALELVTDQGSRWYGFEGGAINSQLRMTVWGFDSRFEEVTRWKKVPEKFRVPMSDPVAPRKHMGLNERHELTGPGSDGLYRYRGATIELSSAGTRHWWATVRFRSEEIDFEARSSDEVLEKAKEWIDSAPEFKGRYTPAPADYGRPYPRETSTQRTASGTTFKHLLFGTRFRFADPEFEKTLGLGREGWTYVKTGHSTYRNPLSPPGKKYEHRLKNNDVLVVPEHGVSGHTVREDRGRSYSMTYGQIPPFEQFEQDIRRVDPDYSDGRAYWPEGTPYPMELVVPDEIAWAEDFGEFEEFRGQYGKRGFRGNEQQIYDFLVFLMDQPDPYEGEEGGSADLASSIMTTLGYEWI